MLVNTSVNYSLPLKELQVRSWNKANTHTHTHTEKDLKQVIKNSTMQTANINDTMLSHMALTYETKIKRNMRN